MPYSPFGVSPGLHAGNERVLRGINIRQKPRNNYNPLSRTSAGELSASERAEAWALAMEDAQGFMGPMQGDTIPGVAPGGGSRDHQMGQYGTGGLDLTDNRPTADPDAVRKRLYGIMGFA